MGKTMKRFFASSILVAAMFHASAHAFLGAFYLGIDAKVQATVKVDPAVLDTINSLPRNLREQFVVAMNASFDRLDESVRTNSKLLGEQVETTSLAISKQWQCAVSATIDKAGEEVKNTTAIFRIFRNACEQRFFANRNGSGPLEELAIAECYVHEYPENVPPNVMAIKTSALQLIANDAICRMRDTAAAPDLLKKSDLYATRYLTWAQLENKNCSTPAECTQKRMAEVKTLVNRAEHRDRGNAEQRIVRAATAITDPTCKLPCYEASLVELYQAEQETILLRAVREDAAAALAKSATSQLTSAKQAADQATGFAAQLANLGQVDAKVKEANDFLAVSRTNARDARFTSTTVDRDMILVFNSAEEVEAVLKRVPGIVQATNAAEAARVAQQRRQAIDHINSILRFPR
jgi:hypothetical protein